MKKLFLRLVSLVTAASLAIGALIIPASAEGYAKKSLPKNDAITFVEDMGAGWNLGNAFDATNGNLANELDFETYWCGAKTTKALIKQVAASGFKTIRVPVSWHDHVDKNFNISSAWLKRVKEVVDWCLDENLYVILNVHHDVLEGYYYPNSKNYKTSEKFLTKVWEQLSEEFKDYDERLVFETINEPRLTGTNFEWWYDVWQPEKEALDALECINKLNQAALDTIRAGGGKNKTRYIMIPGYDTDGGQKGALQKYFKMPKDTVKNRLILDAHLYSISEKDYKGILDGLYKTFVSEGIPVSITEYGLNTEGYNYKKNGSIAEKKFADTAAYARSLGISLVVWDNNYNGEKGFQLINRADAKVTYPALVKALVENGTVKGSTATTATTKVKKPDVTVKKSGTSATLSWNKISGATKYKVYKYSNGKYTLVKTTTKTALKFKGLKKGKTYKYLVTACVNGKWTARSTKDIVTVKIS